MTQKSDPLGKRFGRLIVYREAPKLGPKAAWHCKCDCGISKVIRGNALSSGGTRSCGCIRKEKPNRLSHGQAKPWTKEYRAWQAMKIRCYRKAGKSYKNYGGRGIRVCDEWLKDFMAFFNYIGKAPTPKHSIDRYPDVNGHYEPGNVRWATPYEQEHNKRNRK